MSNLAHNFFNPPDEIKPGQIWHSNELGQNLLITSEDPDYNDIGVYRAMVIKKSDHLSDTGDVRFKLDKMLAMAIGEENVTVRITDGPVSREDLSFYCGEVASKYLIEINKAFESERDYSDSQKFVLEDYFFALQPLRERAIRKVDEAAKKFFDSLQKVNILNWLKETSQPEFVYDYGLAASDGSSEAGANAFWEKESKSDPIKLDSQIEDTELYLTFIDGGLYFVCFSKKFSSMSNIRLCNGSSEIPVGMGSVSFGSRKRMFAHISDTNLLSEGIWELMFEADGELFRIPFVLR